MNEQEQREMVRAYLSEKAKKRWADPDYRARQIAARKRSWMTPERHAAHSAGQKKRWEKKNEGI